MHLRTLDSHDELEAIETLQTEIWHFEPQSVTPRHVFIAAVRSGGLVLGAFDHADTLVGFSLAFRGERNGEPCPLLPFDRSLIITTRPGFWLPLEDGTTRLCT